MAVTTHALVGREPELTRLHALVAAVADGGSGALVLAGPAGVGKSALLERAAADAEALTVLRAAGVEAESDLPFAALDALLRPILDRRTELPPVQAEALERALALAAGDPPDPFAVGAGTLSLLAAAAEGGGVLCVVDDAHWVDPSSLRALAFAARRLGTEAVGIVVAARAERVPAELRGIETLTVGGLGRDVARELLGTVSGGRLPDDFADQLLDAADGNPLVLHELLGRLAPAQLDGREALVGPPPPHARAEDLLGERLATLPDRTRTALLVLGAAGEADVALLGRALGALAPTPLALADLGPAEDAALVALGGVNVTVRHPLVRSVAYHGQPPEARRRAHAAVASALDADDPRRPWHLAAAAAGPDEAVAAALVQLATGARRRGGYPSAARAERRAADLTPDPDVRAQRLLAAADDLERAGVNDEARRIIDEAAQLACAPTTAAHVRGRRGYQALSGGAPRAAHRELRAAADALRTADPPAAARFLLQGAWSAMLVGDQLGWRGGAEEARRLLEDGSDPQTARTAMAMHACALVAAGDVDAADPLLHAVERQLLDVTRDRVPITGAIEVYGMMVRTLVWLERWITADRLLALLVEDARALGAASSLPYLLGVRAELDLRLGRWDSSSASADESVALADAVGDEHFRADGLGVRALGAAMRGEGDRARADAAAALAVGERAAPRLAVDPHRALGLLALGDGRPDEAAGHLDAAARIHDAAGFVEPGSRALEADLIEALVRAGRVEEAARRLDGWEEAGARTGRNLARATAARLRLLLATDDELDARAAAALAAHDVLPMPFERARTLLVHGERLRRARRKTDARQPLREALAAFDQLPAPAWAAKARHELRATGGMVPPRERPGSSELTAHELQVALMVAEGRTNREVAAALFLAPKTIEHHLSAIFRKLGIRRRTELAHALAGSDLA